MRTVFFLACLLSIGACGQNAGDDIKAVEQKLISGTMSVTEALTNESFAYLHPETAFREAIRANAKAERITLSGKNEPGTKILVTGTLTDTKGKPLKNILIYVYHTSDKGWYSATSVHISGNEGDHRHARLFGYLRTDNDGRFSFNTIKPKGYPQSDLAAHIHIQFWDGNGESLHCTGELQFDDDPRMIPERRKQSLLNGFLIVKNSGNVQNPVYDYKIICN